jgi:uncharacterized membrane protein YesL
MAGFFGFFDYTRPGPGVAKDAPPKPRFFQFFEIFSRKFWSLVKLNLLFTLFSLPALIALLFVSEFYIQGNIFPNEPFFDFVIKFVFGALFFCIPLVTVGPAQAGFTYVLRNYAREEHAFLWWDFKEHALKNFKQGMIVSLIDLVVVILVGIDINIYMQLKSDSILTTIASVFLILAFIVYLMMHLYIYPMMVTFKLSIKQLYRNALIFAVIKFFPNLLILIVCAGLIYASFIYPVIGFILFPLITVSVIGFVTNFYVYPKMKRYIMDKVETPNQELTEEDAYSELSRKE